MNKEQDNRCSIILQNKYKLIKFIGRGSYSIVYEAVHITKNHKVAVKFEIYGNKISQKLLQNEINIYLYFLKHRMNDICNIKSFGIYEGRNYIIIDLLYMDLDKYFKKYRWKIIKLSNDSEKNYQELPSSELSSHNEFPALVSYLPEYKYIFEIFMQCVILIQNMHKKQLIHRDIKPDNFLLNKSNKLYIIDFGFSTKYNSEKISKNVIGSYLYCAPNVHKDSYIYEPKYDIISLYFMFFKLLSKRKLPWEGIPLNRKDRKNIVFYYIKKDCNFEEYYKGEELVLKLVKSYENYIYNNKISFDFL